MLRSLELTRVIISGSIGSGDGERLEVGELGAVEGEEEKSES